MNARDRRFPLLDAVRAIAALTVLEFHAAGLYGGGLMGSARPVIARMEVGVVVFLVLSGFLLFRPFLAADVAGEPAPSLAAYTWRRVLRLVPAYWVALAIAALAVPYAGVFTARGIATYFGFAQIYGNATIAAGDPPAWTLGLEVSFYALLPLWAFAVRRIGPRGPRGRLRTHAAALAGLWLFSVAYKAAAFATGAAGAVHSAPVPALVILPGYVDEFALGMALAVVSVAASEAGGAPAFTGRVAAAGRAIGALVARRPGMAWAFAAVAYLLVSFGIGLTGAPSQDYTAVQYLARNVLYGAVAVGIVAPAVIGDRGGGLVRRILGSRLLAFIGLISYGIYVWHFPVLSILFNLDYGQSPLGLGREAEWATVPLLATVAIGALSWVLVERPAMSLRRLVPARRPAPAAVPVPAAPVPGDPGPPRARQ